MLALGHQRSDHSTVRALDNKSIIQSINRYVPLAMSDTAESTYSAIQSIIQSITRYVPLAMRDTAESVETRTKGKAQ